VSFRETTTIELHCDRKNCASEIRIQAETRDKCNLHIYAAGWRLCRGKQICPRHVRIWQRRRARETEEGR
jgi:hypothetical protein